MEKYTYDLNAAAQVTPPQANVSTDFKTGLQVFTFARNVWLLSPVTRANYSLEQNTMGFYVPLREIQSIQG